MKLNSESIEKLSNIITGAIGLSYQRKKSDVDSLLSTYVCKKEKYNDCFYDHPEVRNNNQYTNNSFKLHHYTRLKLQEINGTKGLFNFCNQLINEISYQDTMPEILEYLNTALVKDNYEFIHIEEDDRYTVFSIDGSIVSYGSYFKEEEKVQHILVQEHIDKCIKKITKGDYSGAITNAQSLLEQILIEIRNEIKSTPNKGHSGSLFNLLKDVLILLNITNNLEEGKIKKGYTHLGQGFKRIAFGLSLLRHGMSDAHSISHIPTQKDALLAVNGSKTLANFIVEYFFENRKRIIGAYNG